jgi:hypothetical protein
VQLVPGVVLGPAGPAPVGPPGRGAMPAVDVGSSPPRAPVPTSPRQAAQSTIAARESLVTRYAACAQKIIHHLMRRLPARPSRNRQTAAKSDLTNAFAVPQDRLRQVMAIRRTA